MRKLGAFILVLLCIGALSSCSLIASITEKQRTAEEESAATESAGTETADAAAEAVAADESGYPLLVDADGVRIYLKGYSCTESFVDDDQTDSRCEILLRIQNDSRESCVVDVREPGITVNGELWKARIVAKAAPEQEPEAVVVFMGDRGQPTLTEEDTIELAFTITDSAGTANTEPVVFTLNGWVLSRGIPAYESSASSFMETGAGYTTEPATSEVPVSSLDTRPLRVGIINSPPDESVYRAANVADFERVLTAENGYDTDTFYSDVNREQVLAAQQYMNDGIDYLLLSAVSAAGWTDVLQAAHDAGTRVVLFDRLIDITPDLYAGAVVSDMAEEGQTAVDWLCANVDRPKVVHIQGALGTEVQVGRTMPLETAQRNGHVQLVAQQNADWNEEAARAFMKSVIQSGADFNVIYSESDAMTRGAVEALDEAGITHGADGDVTVVSFDCNKWALREVQAGRWNYEGQCSPFQADAVAALIERMENGENLEGELVIVPDAGFSAETITAADVQQYGLGD